MTSRTAPARRTDRDIVAVLGRLPEVERAVVTRRAGLHDGHPTTLANVARDLHMTSQEVADIERRAFDRLREVVPARTLRRMLTTAHTR